ncbi:hypothetical protein HY416_01500 [Candidatus Kaiserbacteria bacterium]|nr:hypothetical protein [Candidatus Kaiserbacteria bacterium]
MTKGQVKKNIALSLDFDTYVARNPRVLRSVPKGVNIILTSARDNKLSDSNMQMARSARSGRFVVAHKESRGWTIDSFPPKDRK